MVRSRLAAGAACVLAALLYGAPNAQAASVIELGAGGRVQIVDDPFVSGPALTPAPIASASAARAGKGKRHRPPQKTMVSELRRLWKAGLITGAEHQQDLAEWNRVLRTVKRLRGTRAAELESVVQNLHGIAAGGQLTPTRLPALFLTLERNRQWWTTGPLLGYGQRVEFTGSQLVWEYYPGQGIELQELASFGKADGLYTGGPADYPAMKELLGELIPLASQRAGGLTWEYYFHFDGGSPPWTSAMSQGTALEALARASKAFADPSYLEIAHQALPVLETPPPAGVSVTTRNGERFLQYSFAPGTAILNAFLQTLIGIYDYAQASDDPAAQDLFVAGNAEALAEVPSYDTGDWSLYQPGQIDSLSYHELVTGFLEQLCQRTSAPVYCTTAANFRTDLTTPPTLTQVTLKARVKKGFSLVFTVSKPSRVGVVITRGDRTVLATSASFSYGSGSFWVPALRGPGTYGVRLAATDLAGNFARISGTLTVAGKRRRKPG